MSNLPINGKNPIVTKSGAYRRYHISTRNTQDKVKWPSPFKVHVRRTGLARLLLKELWHYRSNKDVVLSRPCVYGVFSSPVGGFLPLEQLCVGCLRCTIEFPEFVRVEHNPERRKLGDSYFTFNYVDAVSYEAAIGLIQVKGAGYRGKFGGEGWDGMWTDMSEIVRPTRDGIHGREFISTVVDIGYTPNFILFDEAGMPYGQESQSFALPIPILFDTPPDRALEPRFTEVLARSAAELESLAVLPLEQALHFDKYEKAVVPLLRPDELDHIGALSFAPRMIEMDGWDQALFDALLDRFPNTVIALRTALDDKDLLAYAEAGVAVFHLVANYHGRSADGRFVLDLIRDAHHRFVAAGVRQEVTLIGSGGIIAAEHVPKAILCGLDAVALDTPLLVALQASFEGDCVDGETSDFRLPKKLDMEWSVQRLKNLISSWRDQMLEILGAMGLREVRRLRGEMGRAMFMKTLEAEAFAELEGYDG